MNTNHILYWAHCSGINVHTYTQNGLPASVDIELLQSLMKFADYAARLERNRCAKMCDRMAKDKKYVDVANETARQLAEKIRTVRLP
jgi:hypothetical protein